MKGKIGTFLWIAALALLLSSCGNSGGDNTSVAEGGIGGSGMTVGAITGFGSIFVNGIEFETGTATVEVDGQPNLDDTWLKVGMVVSVEGSISSDGLTGTANTVVNRKELAGPLSANTIDIDKRVVVMGQTIEVSAQTVYEENASGYATPADIPADGSVVVEVNGYPDGRGLIYATRVEVKEVGWTNGSSEIEVKGIVEGLTTTTFTLGGLTVDFSAPESVYTPMQSGDYVQVKSTQGFNGSGHLIAAVIELEEGGDLALDGAEGDEYQLEGYITTALSGDLFALNGQWVQVTSTTDTGGSDLTLVGNLLEVHGVLDANGVLVADEIRSRSGAEVHIGAEVDDVDTVASTVTALGLPVRILPTTVITDETGMMSWPLQLSALLNGYVELEVGRDESDNLVAVRLEVVDVTAPLPSVADLEGLVTSLNPLQVEGVTITDNGLLSPGTVVGDELSISGTWDGSSLNAASI